jgi:hypothetical protein
MLSPSRLNLLGIWEGCACQRNFSCATSSTAKSLNFHKIPNIPEDPDLAVVMGKYLCNEILEPLQATFGRISIRSGYRSPSV